MAGIIRRAYIDEDNSDYIKRFNRLNNHVWQAVFKEGKESRQCSFKISCIDRDKLVSEIESMKESMPNIIQVGSIQFVSCIIDEYDNKYSEPLVEGFSMTKEDLIKLRGYSETKEEDIFDKLIKIKK